MALLEVNWNPSRKELRAFAALLIVFAAIVSALVYRRTGSFAWGGGIASVGTLLGCLGLAVPGAIRYLYMGWMAAAWPIGWLVSHVALAIVYFGLFTVFGGLMRLLGSDPMERRFDRSATTYWKVRTPASNVGRYFRQF